MKMCKKKVGFTLVELMIAMVSSAILALIVALILFMSYREWRADNEYARLRRDAAFAVQIMAKDIRNSSYSNITEAINNSLKLSINAVHSNSTAFARTSASNLTYSINGTSQGQLITKGLKVFNPQPTNNGVLLNLVLVNTDGDISITNQTFIHTRN
jgi:Tfp pilus assembly protein PilW